MAGVHGAAAALRGLDLAAAPLGNPIKLLQDELAGRFKEDGAPTQELLRIGALNVNSIATDGKPKQIENIIRKKGFHIFIVIETHLKDGHTEPSLLKHFHCVRKDRLYTKKTKSHSKNKTTGFPTTLNTTAGGGILIYIKDTIVYKVRSKGEYAESNVEFLHIEITSPVKLHLVALYSPDKVLVDHVISLMSYFLDPLDDRKIMFIGDTNIDKYDGGLGNAFFDALSRKPYEVKQLIDQITHGRACIDHIFTNMEVLESGVMECSIADHKGIYCTIAHSTTAHSTTAHSTTAHSTTDPDQVQAPPHRYEFQERNQGELKTLYVSGELIRGLMKALSDICNNGCILAIVCKFEGKVFPPKILFDEHPYLRSDCHKNEGMYYISVDAVDDTEQKLGLLQLAISRLHKKLKIDVQKSKKQCIIFTRRSQTNVFHALQKKMWYKDWGWDVVWQPRHVEFLDVVLEPSLTHAFSQNGNFFWNMLQEGELKSIELEESSYRYWSEGGSISRLTFEQQDDT